MVTAAWILATLSALIALALELIPGLRKRWDALSWEAKRSIWLVGALLLGLAPWALGCASRITGINLAFVSWIGTCEIATIATGLQIGCVAYFASQAAQGAAHLAKKGATTNG